MYVVMHVLMCTCTLICFFVVIQEQSHFGVSPSLSNACVELRQRERNARVSFGLPSQADFSMAGSVLET